MPDGPFLIAAAAWNAAVRHARGAAPNECAGLLIGDADRIEDARPLRCAEAGPRFFEIDPLALADAEESIRGTGRRIVGYYHSHVDAPATPSALDQARHQWPDLPPHWHLIISVRSRASVRTPERCGTGRLFDMRTRPWAETPF